MNLREITDIASEAALKKLQETQTNCVVVALEDCEKDRPAREAMCAKAIELGCAEKDEEIHLFQDEKKYVWDGWQKVADFIQDSGELGELGQDKSQIALDGLRTLLELRKKVKSLEAEVNRRTDSNDCLYKEIARLEAEKLNLQERNDNQTYDFERLERLLNIEENTDKLTKPIFDAIQNLQRQVEQQSKASPWISVKERMPTKEDADKSSQRAVLVMSQSGMIGVCPYDKIGSYMWAYWAPVIPPPQPSAEEKMREEFEAWYATHGPRTPNPLNKDLAWAAWQAARKEKP